MSNTHLHLITHLSLIIYLILYLKPSIHNCSLKFDFLVWTRELNGMSTTRNKLGWLTEVIYGYVWIWGISSSTFFLFSSLMYSWWTSSIFCTKIHLAFLCILQYGLFFIEIKNVLWHPCQFGSCLKFQDISIRNLKIKRKNLGVWVSVHPFTKLMISMLLPATHG